MSDGCAGQYKNSYNFANVFHHEYDFCVRAEWHFCATSHGKSAADGIGGTVKWTAAKAILQCPLNNQILTPVQFYEYASTEISGIHFAFATSSEYEKDTKMLLHRYKHCRTVSETRALNSVFDPPDKEYGGSRAVFIKSNQKYWKSIHSTVQWDPTIFFYKWICYCNVWWRLLAWMCHQGELRGKVLKF